MYTQFFGNYLLSQNLITQDQLFEAIKGQNEVKQKLGTLAIYEGYMAAEEVEEVVEESNSAGRKFGEIAVEKGILTPEQIQSLLKHPGSDYLLLAQKLVENGVFTYAEMQNIIVDYRSYNEIFDLSLTEEVAETVQTLYNNFFLVSEDTVTLNGRMYMELLFNNLVRMVGDDFVPLTVETVDEYPTECCTSQGVYGNYSVVSYIDMCEETAIGFASRYIGDTFTEYNEYVKASMDDFLNLHNGLFIVNVSNENSDNLTLSAPQNYDNQLLTFDATTYHFTVLYSFGKVHLLLTILKKD